MSKRSHVEKLHLFLLCGEVACRKARCCDKCRQARCWQPTSMRHPSQKPPMHAKSFQSIDFYKMARLSSHARHKWSNHSNNSWLDTIGLTILNNYMSHRHGPTLSLSGNGHGHGASIETLSLVGLGVPPQTSSIRSPAQFERRVTQPKLDDMPPLSAPPAAEDSS
jgi:hypothetical protein